MRRIALALSLVSLVSLVGCGGSAAGGAGASGGSKKAEATAEVNAARAEAAAQEKKLSELRQEKAALEAPLEGKGAPAAPAAPEAAPAPAATPAPAAGK